MTKKELENPNILKEEIKETVRLNAEVNYKFDKEVNDILKRDGYYRPISTFPPKFAVKMAEDLCNVIIDSDLSTVNKDIMMSALYYFINGAASAEHLRSQDFEDRLKDIDLVVSHYKMEEDNKSEIFPTAGTTETHKTEVVE